MTSAGNGKRPVNTPATGPGDGGEASGTPAGGPGNGNPRAEPFNAQWNEEHKTTHGAHSERRVAAEAESTLEKLRREGAPWLAEIDRYALHAWAWAEARCNLIRKYLDKRLPSDSTNAAEQLLLKWEGKAAAARRQLGFDPLSRAQLGKDTAIGRAAASATVERMIEQGRVIEERRRVQVEAVPSDAEAVGGGSDGV